MPADPTIDAEVDLGTTRGVYGFAAPYSRLLLAGRDELRSVPFFRNSRAEPAICTPFLIYRSFINAASTNVPFKALSQLKVLAQRPVYAHVKLPFIEDPKGGDSGAGQP